ncbi:hypothetical protein FHG87_017184 [Trinorchestia longiramus]|nr:hypothetical protein FHG87_017184 [Trinorchestia longiramus]
MKVPKVKVPKVKVPKVKVPKVKVPKVKVPKVKVPKVKVPKVKVPKVKVPKVKVPKVKVPKVKVPKVKVSSPVGPKMHLIFSMGSKSFPYFPCDGPPSPPALQFVQFAISGGIKTRAARVTKIYGGRTPHFASRHTKYDHRLTAEMRHFKFLMDIAGV